MIAQLPDSSQFNIKDCIIRGDECVLITPKDMGAEWDSANVIFRSSIWRKSDMYPISLGFKKFFNLGEKPEFEPINHYSDLEFVRKLDGSCLIISSYKGELIARTRGTIDATKLQNGYEIELLKQKYPKVFDNIWLDFGGYTLLFEWTTPTNRIVLQESEDPMLWLIGIVDHENYKYFTQFELDQQAIYLGVPRPERYELSIENVTEYLKDKDTIEGVVIYADNDQILKKVKTPRYLYLHKVFTGIKTVDNLFDLFVEYGCSSRENFEALLATNFDWELVKSLEAITDELFRKWTESQVILDQLRTFVNTNRSLPRKEIAKLIIDNFGKWSNIAFELLDNRQHNPRKIFELCLK